MEGLNHKWIKVKEDLYALQCATRNFLSSFPMFISHAQSFSFRAGNSLGSHHSQKKKIVNTFLNFFTVINEHFLVAWNIFVISSRIKFIHFYQKCINNCCTKFQMFKNCWCILIWISELWLIVLCEIIKDLYYDIPYELWKIHISCFFFT